MRGRVRISFEFLSMSTLDLFASILGAFVLFTFVLLPYYLREPALEAQVGQADAEISARAAELSLAREKLLATQSARVDAEATLAAAQLRMATTRVPEPEEKAAPVAAPPVAVPKPGTIAIPPLDLVIAIDTTGSMRDELVELQASIFGVIRILNRLSPSLAVGIVAYRDAGEEYVTRVHPLTSIKEPRALDRTLAFVDALNTKGGGDDPEAVEVALAEALKMPWRDQTMGRLVVIGDAPARPAQVQTAFDLAARYRASDPARRVVSAVYAGDDGDPARFFFEQLGKAGGGDFRVHRGEMIESILLSVLADANRTAASREEGRRGRSP